jgi:predicted deacylase
VVQAGVSGLEIEPAMELPAVVKDLDPQDVSGTLVLVPLLNTSGFEFEQINAAWDDMNLDEIGRGRPDGSVSEQMVHQYFKDVIDKADALLDVRSGSQWSYHRYAGVYETGNVSASKSMAVALGLPQVLVGQPVENSIAFAAAEDGKKVVSAYIGGGPGLREFRVDDMARVRRAVLNAMRHLGMLPGALEQEEDRVSIIAAHTVLQPRDQRGFTFMDSEKRGKQVSAGDTLGYVRHPFTGEILEQIAAPRDGFVIFAGASWPVVPEGVTLAILGDLVEEISKS